MAFGLLGGFWGPLRVHIAYIVGIYDDPRVKAPYHSFNPRCMFDIETLYPSFRLRIWLACFPLVAVQA